jgi:hypothetical protein
MTALLVAKGVCNPFRSWVVEPSARTREVE